MFVKETEALQALFKHWRTGGLEKYKEEIESFGGTVSDPSAVSITGDDTDYHPNLTPIPYVGDLTKAKVFLLMLNPGYKQFYEIYEQAACEFEKFPCRFDGSYGGYGEPDDVYGDYYGRYGEKIIENLGHRSRQRFWPIEGEASSTDFGKYWVRMLTPVFQKIGSWDSIAEKFAMLNLIPYRSAHFKETKKVFECASCKLIRNFVHEDLLKRENTLVIVARRPKVWGVEVIGYAAKTHVFHGVECRRIHLHGVADKIAKFLSKN
jgi:hypothetical protein